VQQAEVISLSGTTQAGKPRLPVQVLTGETKSFDGKNADLWSDDAWKRFLRDQRVLVSKPELVRRVLSKGLLKMEDVGLLVVDECHHCASGKNNSSKHPVAV